MSVLVVAEQARGTLRGVTLEAVAAGQQLGAALGVPVSAAVLGTETEPATSELAGRKLERVWRVEHPLLADYSAEGYTSALAQLAGTGDPAWMVFPHTYQTRDYAPKLAARLGRPLMSDVVGIGVEPGAAVFTRQIFQGRLLADLRVMDGGPCLVSVQAGAFRGEQAEPGSASVEVFTPRLAAGDIRVRAEAPFRETGGAVDLASAEVIVAVGRGIQDQANLPLVEALAQVLGAELAASRPVCDNGWLGLERQVGSSGQTVAPKLYVAVGISGAIQHVVGMKGSRTVVAINKDASAPIFEMADYGIAGDLFDVVPALTEAVRNLKG